MRNLLLVALLFVAQSLFAQTDFVALKLTPAKPRAGDKVSFEYNAAYSPLIKSQPVQVVVYTFANGSYKALEPALLRKGSLYTGTITLGANDNTLGFKFYKDDKSDNNKGNGYVVPVYDEQGKPVQDYYATAFNIQSGMGSVLGMEANKDKAKAVINDALAADATIINNNSFLDIYINHLLGSKDKNAKDQAVATLNKSLERSDIKEQDYSLVANWYARLKMQSASDSIRQLMKDKFPNGKWNQDEAFMNFRKEKDLAKKEALYADYIKRFPPKEDDKALVEFMQSTIAQGYSAKEDKTALMTYAKNLSPASRASIYNDVAWNMAEEGEDLATAKKMSWEATNWAKQQTTKPTEPKNDRFTKKQFAENNLNRYAMYADTYGFILYKMGDYKTGLQYAKDGASINKFKDPEYNERYAQLLEKASPLPQAKSIIEGFVKDGKASEETKKILKNLYTKQNGSDKGYDAYHQILAEAAKVKQRAELVKTMLNDPAPKFTLKDFDGKNVSLSDYAGKVVVLDFWATWCGPCIASMPGMKAAQEKYKDVQFLFIDTWENVENKLSNAKDFMAKKGYPFYVLMDDDNKVVTDYQVSGIPTKFILDRKGNIRFKSVGYSGNADALVDELGIMVDLARK